VAAVRGACGPEAIDELLRARGTYGEINKLFVLTNADRFSRTAHDRAEKYGIRLIDRNQLVHWPQQLI
jgi:HJR/Mrr/RecB family endonuclease